MSVLSTLRDTQRNDPKFPLYVGVAVTGLLASVLLLRHIAASEGDNTLPPSDFDDVPEVKIVDEPKKEEPSKKENDTTTATKSTSSVTSSASASASASDPSSKANKKRLEEKLTAADKEGKSLFKEKSDPLGAAKCFTEAIEACDEIQELFPSTNLQKQKITLLNNRSAMYEKGGQEELALSDCDEVLKIDKGHIKARQKKAR